jgi:hypothetical protein
MATPHATLYSGAALPVGVIRSSTTILAIAKRAISGQVASVLRLTISSTERVVDSEGTCHAAHHVPYSCVTRRRVPVACGLPRRVLGQGYCGVECGVSNVSADGCAGGQLAEAALVAIAS